LEYWFCRQTAAPIKGGGEIDSKIPDSKIQRLIRWWRLVSCQLVLLTAVVTAALKLLKDFNGIIMMLVVQLFV
jgi:hypothetical protein